MADWIQDILFVLKQEGVKFDVNGAVIDPGYVNDPRDPGGETKFGISKRAHPNEDITNLTYERALEIYKTEYWDAHQLDSKPDVWALFLLDSFVQHNPGVVEGFAAGNNSIGDAFWARMRYYISLHNFNIYAHNWMTRMANLRDALKNYYNAII